MPMSRAGNGSLLTVGAEDGAGTAGANYYYNGTGTLPTSGTILRVTTAVPEPSTYALTGLAGLAVLLYIRRKPRW